MHGNLARYKQLYFILEFRAYTHNRGNLNPQFAFSSSIKKKIRGGNMASLFIEPKSVATKPQYQYGEVGAGSRIRIKRQASLPFPCLHLNSA